ncbi:unnamed protein product [Miscanthus lutarioriparius]|uniref:Uncharacterized protein n=1 Tax=Miscanthus lutarioriparius TaxID=422564 RepID=A0A811MHR3_9POAL|nr:unnamed protein product [Miscanthus lutarioriparius]
MQIDQGCGLVLEESILEGIVAGVGVFAAGTVVTSREGLGRSTLEGGASQGSAEASFGGVALSLRCSSHAVSLSHAGEGSGVASLGRALAEASSVGMGALLLGSDGCSTRGVGDDAGGCARGLRSVRLGSRGWRIAGHDWCCRGCAREFAAASRSGREP